MILQLLCIAAHSAVPDLSPGNRVMLALGPAQMSVTVEATPGVLQGLLAAMRAGALKPDGPQPAFEEIEADVLGRWAELTARLARLEAQAPPRHLHLAG